MANESNKTTIRRVDHDLRIPAKREHYQPTSLKIEAKKLSDERGITMEQATYAALADRREYARKLAEDAKTRRSASIESGKESVKKRKTDPNDPAQVAAMTPIRFESIDGKADKHDRKKRAIDLSDLDPAQVTRAEIDKIVVRKAAEKDRARQQRIQLRDSLVLRADAFAAFVLIVEKKGVPAHIIDERKFAAIVTQKRWDLMPDIMTWLIREDAEIKVAFQAFCDAAKQCTENLRVGASKVSGQASEIISEKYREMFLQAASIYARKMSHLEMSLDRLDVLPVDELQKLVDDGDQLSKRIADLSLRVADELKRRDGKGGGEKANKAYNTGRAKVYSWLLINIAMYEEKDDLDGAAHKIKEERVVSVAWRTIRGYITDYRKLSTEEVQLFINESIITE